jgi:TetR/AcrR family transcriptional regulator, transcriptional repressor for nem operon
MTSGTSEPKPAAADAPRLTRKGHGTYERIVTAAATLMFKAGVAGTTTQDVQAAAGVSASQLYHYFTDKRALVRAVIAHQTDAILAAQEPLLSQLDTIESLHAWRDQIIAIQHSLNCEGGCPIGSLGAEIAEADPEARTEVAAGFARWEAPIRQGLTAMHTRGELRKDANPDKLALGLLAALQGGLLLTQIRRDTAPLEAALDLAIDHIQSLTTRRRAKS